MSRDYPVDPDEFSRVFDDAVASADALHEKLVDGTQYAGYIRRALTVARRIYSLLATRASEEPELIPVLSSGLEYVKALADDLRRLKAEIRPTISRLHTITSTAFSITSSSGVLLDPDLLNTLDESPFVVPPFLGRDREKFALRFDAIDPSLGETYRGSWESYHGGRSDPIRGALFLMRQTFDHLFHFLSPDEAVRSSEYWQPKSGDDPNRVYRTERIQYAAFTHIKDQSLARTFAAAASQITDIYDQLNRAHQRGEIDQDKATGALVAMSQLLEDWIEAIDPEDQV